MRSEDMNGEKACSHDSREMQKSCISIVPIFNHLERAEMAEIVKTTQSVTFKRGETLYNAGGSIQFFVHYSQRPG